MNDLSNAMADMVAKMKAAKGIKQQTAFTTEEKIAARNEMMAKRIESYRGEIPYQPTAWCDLDRERVKEKYGIE